MPYLGNQPTSGGYHKLDNLTASATDTYALTLGGSAYYPATANQLMVSLNGVIQAPQDSFTISGSNIVFASTLSASDSIDFIMSFGDVYGIGTPADGTITDAKIQSMAASKLTGALPAIDGSALTGLGGGTSVAVIADQKAQGTNGGTATSGAWQTRDLNTELGDPDGIVSISSNQFILSAGDYIIQWSCPAIQTEGHQTRLYNDTATSVIALGQTAFGSASFPIQQNSNGSAYVNLTASANLEIQHRVVNTKATNGFGAAANIGTETYTVVTIFKVG